MMHLPIMHLSMTLDPDTCMYDAFFNFLRSLTLMHTCMVHESMMRYFLVTDEPTNRRTNGQGDSRSLISTAPAPAPPKCALLLHLLSFIITVLLHIGTKVAKIYVLTCQKNLIMRKD